MAEILLFHHICGLTDGVHALADDLRAAGHVVHLPDLFAGARFDSIDDGAAHVDEVGFSTIVERGVSAADELPAGVVYGGISLGVMPAQRLAQTRPGAAGAVLFEACAPVSEFSASWPDEVRVQIHGMDNDPFFAGEGDIDAARQLVEQAPDRAELFTYPGDQHLFTDRSLPSHDAGAANLALTRTLALLADLDSVST